MNKRQIVAWVGVALIAIRLVKAVQTAEATR